MLPRLGELFPNAIEVISRPRHEYLSMAYAELHLPKAPAIMVGDKVITEGQDMDESMFETAIRHHLEPSATIPAAPATSTNIKEETTMNTSTSDQSPIALTVQLSAKMLAILHDTVAAKGVDLNTLIAGYISNGIEHDLPEVHRKCFFTHTREILKKHNVPTAAIDEIVDKFGY